MMAALHRSRFMRFLLIGGLATLVHVAVFTGLVEWLAVSAVLAAVPAFLSAMLFSVLIRLTPTYATSGCVSLL